MFIIMTMLAFGVFLLLLLTQLPGLKTPEGNPGLLSFGVAGLISWVTWLSAAIALKATVPLFMTEEFDTGPFVSSCVVAFALVSLSVGAGVVIARAKKRRGDGDRRVKDAATRRRFRQARNSYSKESKVEALK